MANMIQRILVRTDLGMSEGLMAAQVAHIHSSPFLLTYKTAPSPTGVLVDEIATVKKWMDTPYMFVHGVPNKEVLRHFMDKCEDRKVWFQSWSDTIYVDISPTQKQVFDDVLVGISMGPADSDALKTIVGDLPLL